MSRAVTFACWASLSACFSAAPTTDSGGDPDDTGSSTGESSGGEPSTGEAATSLPTTGAELTSDSVEATGDPGSSGMQDESSTGDAGSELVLIDIDVDVCGAVWTDDFAAVIDCPSAEQATGSVRPVEGDPVQVETLDLLVEEDAIVTQPHDGSMGQIRGVFALPPLVGDEHVRATVACVSASACDVLVEIFVVPVGAKDVPGPLDTYALSSANRGGVEIDVALAADPEASELWLYVTRADQDIDDVIAWLDPRVAHVVD